MNNLQPITLEILVGGDVLAEVDAAIARVCEDVIHRPSLDKARTVTLKISVRPNWVGDDESAISRFSVDRKFVGFEENRPTVSSEVVEKVPGYASRVVNGMVDDTGSVVLVDPTRSSARDQMDLPANVADFGG